MTTSDTLTTDQTAPRVHECEHCGERTEDVAELAGVIKYHDDAECVGGVERFQQ